MSRALKKVHELLIQLESGKTPYPQLLDRALSTSPRRIRAEISESAAMVLRHRKTLRALLAASSKRLLKKVRIEFSAALELAVLSLLIGHPCDRVIANLSSLVAGKKNLEKASRGIQKLSLEIVSCRQRQESDKELIDRGRGIPLSKGRLVVLTKDLLGVQERSAAARLSLLYSLPESLCQSWLKQFNESQVEHICQISNEAPPLFARAQRLKITPIELLSKLAESDIEAQECGPETPDGLLLGRGKKLFRKSSLFQEGFFTIQDLTAQRAPLSLAPQANEEILDLCAAPGGKTTYLAEIMNNRGHILAVDRKRHRLHKVEEACKRLGLSIVETQVADGRDGEALGKAKFDRILIDAPCSNTGVLRRRPEARWRYQRKSQKRFVQDQQELLRFGSNHLKRGGFLLYSVCSIEEEEGAGIVRWLLSGAGGSLDLCQEMLELPALAGGDGGYQALLRKK
jgi:16S rRNA (cytosine967-C5)-methyltransferase